MDLFKSYDPIDIYKHFKLFEKIKKDLFNLLANGESFYPLNIRLTHASHGSLKFPDAYILKRILYMYKPKTILEIGSFLGFSTRWLLEVSKNWDTRVTAIDPNIRHRTFDSPRQYVEKLNSLFYPNKLEILTGFFGSYDDHIYYDYEHYEPKRDRSYVDQLANKRAIINKNWQRKFDFIFIDGDHSYKSALNNFEIAFELLNEGGCITFHDALTWKGVNKALREIKDKFNQKAEVNIHGKFDKVLLKLLLRTNDGIGSFKLLK